jgi:hypothetical protein
MKQQNKIAAKAPAAGKAAKATTASKTATAPAASKKATAKTAKDASGGVTEEAPAKKLLHSGHDLFGRGVFLYKTKGGFVIEKSGREEEVAGASAEAKKQAKMLFNQWCAVTTW